LQYADDTLLLIQATTQAAHKLKLILDDFASATGLQINFSKTTYIPMNVLDSVATEIATILGTDTQSFPQTYLGLPLSPTKLPAAAFQPLIDRIDVYLADGALLYSLKVKDSYCSQESWTASPLISCYLYSYRF
jgi:hypothetical protein